MSAFLKNFHPFWFFFRKKFFFNKMYQQENSRQDKVDFLLEQIKQMQDELILLQEQQQGDLVQC